MHAGFTYFTTIEEVQIFREGPSFSHQKTVTIDYRTNKQSKTGQMYVKSVRALELV
jgi:hypothetical protein